MGQGFGVIERGCGCRGQGGHQHGVWVHVWKRIFGPGPSGVSRGVGGGGVFETQGRWVLDVEV